MSSVSQKWKSLRRWVDMGVNIDDGFETERALGFVLRDDRMIAEVAGRLVVQPEIPANEAITVRRSVGGSGGTV